MSLTLPSTTFRAGARTRAVGAVAALASLAALALAPGAVAEDASARRGVPAASASDTAVPPLGDGLGELSLDVRDALPRLAPTAVQRRAASALARSTGATTQWNRTGTPRAVRALGRTLSAPSDAAPADVARGWLRDHASLLGISRTDVARLAVVRDHELPRVGGAHVVSFAQTFAGVPAALGSILTVLVDGRGRVVSYTGDPVRTSALTGSFDLSPEQALQRVAGDLLPDLDGTLGIRDTGETAGDYTVFESLDTGLLGFPQYVRQVAFPTSRGARAAYAVLFVRHLDEAWATIVDAATGRTLFRKSLVQHETDPLAGDGLVFENYPGAKRGGKQVVKSFGKTAESPGGWLDPTGLVGLPGVTTTGNNANSVIAWTVPLVAADQYNRPVSPTARFRYGFTNSWARTDGSPTGYQADRESAATNLFYHHNRIHDEFYDFGFTESGGNFQLVNPPGTGGQGGDPIMGGAQSGALNLTAAVLALGRNNANMLTLPDGIPGFTNMYLWEFVDDVFEAPARDGDYDATIIQHEYAHGLSNRYVGGGGLGSLSGGQSGAMGEGWGDWYAMNDLFRRNLSRTAVTAPYVGDPQRGIRNWNYARSPLTYGDYGYDMSGPEVHSDGEIWTAALWTLREKILRSVRGDQQRASDIAEHLVTDAMPIAPPTPSFLDMRDAILTAAQLRYGKRFTNVVWDAFAERGMGVSASTTGESDTDPVPGFDVADRRRNGVLRLTVRNASTGKPVSGVRVLGGMFEGRGTPLLTTSRTGLGRARMDAGRYTLTLQAPGFGIQRVPVTVRAGRTERRTLRLSPNLASVFAGATMVRTTSEQGALPGENAFDDAETTAWRTADGSTPYNKGRNASATVKFKKPSTVREVAVSVVKPIGLPRFSAANKVLVQTSKDGRSWRTVKIARFSYQMPRPAVSDLMLKTFRLKKPVKARFLRAVPDSVFGSGATYGSSAVVAEVQAFGTVKNLTPRLPKPDAPVSLQGSVSVGNPAQGQLLGLDPYRPGVTELSWSCPDLPAANGVDAYINELPAGAGDGKHRVTVNASVPFGEYLITFYDDECQPMSGTEFILDGESKAVPPGAAYTGFLLLYGGAATFEYVVTEPR